MISVGGPVIKRAVAFIDGQNLFHMAKAAFGYQFPNFEPKALSEAICVAQGWQLTQVRFYTGVPSPMDSPSLNHFWNAKLAAMGTRSIATYQRQLMYRTKTIELPRCTCGASPTTTRIGQEKGIDLRLALDIVKECHARNFDVALVFSQDQDLSEVADEIRAIAKQQGRWIKIASAYPDGSTNRRGINGTDWIPFDKTLYDGCIDPVDYRKKKSTKTTP